MIARAGAAVLLLLLFGGSPPPAPAQDAVRSGADALRQGPDYPWYDRENDGLRRIHLEPRAEPPRPLDWEPAPRRAGNSGLWAAFWEVLKWMAWILLAALLVLILYLLIRAFLLRRSAVPEAGEEETVGTASDVDRLENLPFQVRRRRGNLLDEARRQYEQGNYSEAIIYLFSYQLVEMDKSQIIRLARGKTNRQYLREVGSRRVLGPLLEQTMIAFEDVFFGSRVLEKRRFEACWNRLDQFHEQIEHLSA